MSMAVKVSKSRYRGDPGLFGDILGGITGAVTGFVTGGPGGAVSGALRGSGLVRPPTPAPGTGFTGGPMILPPAPGGGRGGLLQRITQRAGGMTGKPVLRMGGGGVPATRGRAIPTQPTGMPPGMNGVKPFYPAAGPPPGPGYKLNTSGYWRVSPAGTPFYVEPGMAWVKRRRKNPANAKANSAAIRRIKGAKNMAKHLSRITIREKCK